MEWWRRNLTFQEQIRGVRKPVVDNLVKAEESLKTVQEVLSRAKEGRAQQEMDELAGAVAVTSGQQKLQQEVVGAKEHRQGANVSIQVFFKDNQKALFKPRSGEVFLRREVPV